MWRYSKGNCKLFFKGTINLYFLLFMVSYKLLMFSNELIVFVQITLNSIIEEIGGDVFSLLIDEAADVSDKEQMKVVLRYLSNRGFIIERLVGIEHVKETS